MLPMPQATQLEKKYIYIFLPLEVKMFPSCNIYCMITRLYCTNGIVDLLKFIFDKEMGRYLFSSIVIVFLMYKKVFLLILINYI